LRYQTNSEYEIINLSPAELVKTQTLKFYVFLCVSTLLCEGPHGVELKYIENVVWEPNLDKRNVHKCKTESRN
jgi:hypothetical protein